MKSLLRLVVSLAAFSAAGTPVWAQAVRPERPYRGLFGGGVGDAQQLLTLNLSGGGGYDDNVLADQGLGGVATTATAGRFGDASAGLTYSFTGPEWSFGASAGSSFRYAPQVYRDVATGWSTGLGLSGPLWRGARIDASASAGRQPFYSLAVLPVLVEPPLGNAPIVSGEYAALPDDYFSYSGSVGLSQSVSRRGSLSFRVDAHRSDFAAGGRGDTTTLGAYAGYGHNLAKGLSLRLGYGYRESRAGDNAVEPAFHTLDAGVDFNRAISFSRRTSLAFSTGTAAVSDGGDPRYHVIGGVSLRHEIGRTWSAAAGYQRQVQFIEALADSYLTDGASATLSGLISRTLQFNSQVSAGFAHPGGAAGGSEFDSYLASAGLQYAVTRTLALGVDYSLYRYSFPLDSTPPPGFGHILNRHSVRVHLSFWTPLIYKARRLDAAR